jgi:esterase/lipase superfamily enzyme
MFNGERADQASYASTAVSIPPDTVRKIGEVQWPTTTPPDPQHIEKRAEHTVEVVMQ